VPAPLRALADGAVAHRPGSAGAGAFRPIGFRSIMTQPTVPGSSPDTESQSCFHCGLPVPPGSAYGVHIDGQYRAMCCPGCQAVAQAIVDGGLTDFYRYRTEQSRTGAGLVPEELRELELFDRPELQQSFVRTEAENVREAALILEGIVCAACVWLNERHVGTLPGVLEFTVNYSTHRARVRWDDSRIHLSDILKAIAAIGYVAHPFDTARQDTVHKRERSLAMRRIAVAGLGMVQVMMLAVAMYAGDYDGMQWDIRDLMRWVSLLIATPVVLYAARPFFQSAWRDLRHSQLGMDVPVAIAVGSAFAASAYATVVGHGEIYYDSVTMFVFFLLTGRFLEMMGRHRAGRAAEELVRLLPAAATRLRDDGSEEVVPVTELAPGDRVLVRPGDTVPADGSILEGLSSVDESLLTGESLPQAKKMNDSLVGGTVNVESPLIMCVEKVGGETVLSSIVRLLDRAQTEKPKLALVADRAAGWFVAALLVLAMGVAFWWWHHDPSEAFRVTLSVLVVTCPCALSLATPAAVTAATGALTRLGVLTTRGHALETLAQATHVVFDKTGTLTEGRLALDKVVPLRDLDPDRCLAVAAALEQGSEHPVAQALRRAASPATLAVADARSTPGEGIEGAVQGRRYRIGTPEYITAMGGGPLPQEVLEQGATQVVLGDEQGPVAVFVLADRLRSGAVDTVRALSEMGLQVALLSGDAPEAVAHIARTLGIEEAHARLKPQDKLDYISRLQADGAVVAMVGDGVNDAPVLARAQVSLAMGSGTQLAQATADMVLLSEHLPHLAQAAAEARRTMGIIHENFAWAVLYNVIAVPAAAAGLVAPWMAAIGMSTSSLLVVLNALRLTRPIGAGRRPPVASKPRSEVSAQGS